MVLKRGIWETRPKHWSSNSNCICFVFEFASNTLQAKVRLSIAWLNVSVLVKKNSSDLTQINASAVMIMPEHFWRTTTQRRCYTPPPVLAQPPCHKMSGIWLLPRDPSHLSIEPLSKTTIFGPNRVAKLLRWVYTWPQIAHLWREHPILVQMPPAPLCPTSVCCRAQKDTPTILGEFDLLPGQGTFS